MPKLGKIVKKCYFNTEKFTFGAKQKDKITALNFNDTDTEIANKLFKTVQESTGFKIYRYFFLVTFLFIGVIGVIFWFFLVIPIISFIIMLILCLNYQRLRRWLIEGIKKDMAYIEK
jgi:hypothetical protein